MIKALIPVIEEYTYLYAHTGDQCRARVYGDYSVTVKVNDQPEREVFGIPMGQLVNSKSAYGFCRSLAYDTLLQKLKPPVNNAYQDSKSILMV